MTTRLHLRPFIIMLAGAMMTMMATANTAAANDDNATKAATDTVKPKERTLAIVMNVGDHLTHQGIDSLKAVILNAADSSFVDSMKTESWTYNDKRTTQAYHELKQPGDYLLKFSAKGYDTRIIPWAIEKFRKRERFLQLKPVYLHREQKKDDVLLDEVVVKATKLKFYMDGDTLVYNADAFNMAEGSMIGELIKKLPGVEVKDGGEILVNGRKVESLLLNGKDFFDSDRELMLDNMPAYTVKNIQSYERVPERLRGTIQEKNTEKELVMNIKLKKEYNQSWLTNIEGGIGSKLNYAKSAKGDFAENAPTMYLGRLFTMRYDNRSRFTAYASTNNLNDYRAPGEKGEWSPLNQSEGLSTTANAGVGYMFDESNGFRYNGSLNTTYKDSHDASHNNWEAFYEDGNQYSRSFEDRRSYDFDINTNHEFRFNDTPHQSHNTFKQYFSSIRPTFSYRKWNNNGHGANATFFQDVAFQLGKEWMDSITAPDAGELLKQFAVNRNINNTRGDGHNTNVNLSGYVGATPAHNDYMMFGLNASYSYTDYLNNSYSHRLYDYPNGSQPADFRNQYNTSRQRSNGLSINPEFAFAIGHEGNFQVRMSMGYTHNYSDNNDPLYLLSKLEEWKSPEMHPLGMLPSEEERLKAMDVDNSTRSKSTTDSFTPVISFNYGKQLEGKERGYMGMGISMNLPITNETLDYWQGNQVDTVFSRTTTLPRPNFNFYYSKGARHINGGYNLYANAPSMTSLLNIRNTSNPWYISLSNPNLKNSVNQNIWMHFNDKFGRGTLVNASLNYTSESNSIASSKVYDKATGVTIATPQNISGQWRGNINGGVDIPLDKDQKWRISNNIGYSYRNSVDLVTTDINVGEVRSEVGTGNLTDDLRLTWRLSDKTEFSTKGSVNYQHSNSDRKNFEKINAVDFNYGFTAQVELPWKMQLSTDLTMYQRRGYSDSNMNTNELIWNARLTKRVMHGNLLLQLDGFDILGNLSNVRNYVNAQGKTETYYNVIPSYCLFHVTWKLTKKPKKA